MTKKFIPDFVSEVKRADAKRVRIFVRVHPGIPDAIGTVIAIAARH
jgi:hypothetical protein